MWHYIINTESSYNFALKSFDPQLLLVAQLIAEQAISDCIIEESLPDPFNPYCILVVANSGFANFNIYCDDELVSVNTACWSSSKQKSVWETVTEQYLELTQKYSYLSFSPPKCPSSFPWVTTLATPNSKVLAHWLLDFEECLASALVEADRLSLSAI